MDTIIRKISIGANYKEAMHYIVGQKIYGGKAEVHLILKDDDTQYYKIWVRRGDEIIFWKGFSFNLPISIENDLDF